MSGCALPLELDRGRRQRVAQRPSSTSRRASACGRSAAGRTRALRPATRPARADRRQREAGGDERRRHGVRVLGARVVAARRDGQHLDARDGRADRPAAVADAQRRRVLARLHRHEAPAQQHAALRLDLARRVLEVQPLEAPEERVLVVGLLLRLPGAAGRRRVDLDLVLERREPRVEQLGRLQRRVRRLGADRDGVERLKRELASQHGSRNGSTGASVRPCSSSQNCLPCATRSRTGSVCWPSKSRLVQYASRIVAVSPAGSVPLRGCTSKHLSSSMMRLILTSASVGSPSSAHGSSSMSRSLGRWIENDVVR